MSGFSGFDELYSSVSGRLTGDSKVLLALNMCIYGALQSHTVCCPASRLVYSILATLNRIKRLLMMNECLHRHHCSDDYDDDKEPPAASLIRKKVAVLMKNSSFSFGRHPYPEQRILHTGYFIMWSVEGTLHSVWRILDEGDEAEQTQRQPLLNLILQPYATLCDLTCI